MHKTNREAVQFLREIEGHVPADGVDTVLCAPFTALSDLTRAAEGTPVQIGAQNMHWEENGAFTGEVSPVMLRDLGVTYVIIGHSERRQYFNETDETVNQKVKAAFAHDLFPIVCVGENLEEREAGRTEAVISGQTEAALKDIRAEQCARMVIAYEPIWAIGTGKSSSADDAGRQIATIRQVVRDLYGSETADRIRIQYGGSVKPENIDAFMAEPEIDGALVGGASLKPDSFLALIEAAAKERK